jgi:ribonuclease G
VEKELIVHSTTSGVEIALLEDGKLVELHYEETDNDFSVGDIFLGKIRKLMPGLNAAFVDVGHKKDAFLHYTDMGPKLKNVLRYTDSVMNNSLQTPSLDHFKVEPDINKNGKVDQVLAKRQHILVQILKEPIGSKGHRLSCEITIPGRYLVLTPFVDLIAVSKKIANSEERKRLQTIVESIRPKNFGVIVRTAAEGKKTAELHEELSNMLAKWDKVFQQLRQAKPPVKLMSELDKTTSILRDLLSDSFNRIVTDDKDVFESIKSYLNGISPDSLKILTLYKGNKSIFEQYGVTKQIKLSFGKNATMPSGAYLVIEHTEAMHVIDVNSGHKVGNSTDQDASVLAVNVEAAEEIARQLRLRDLGGIIIVDFIDMKDPEHKKHLQKVMRDFMLKDRAQHTVLPLSKFGLMQITRQRVRPELKINTTEPCPACSGSGKIIGQRNLLEEIQTDLENILHSRPKSKLFLHVHPFVEAFLRKGLPSLQWKWYFKYRRWIKIIAEPEYQQVEYRFFDDNEDEIRLNQ